MLFLDRGAKYTIPSIQWNVETNRISTAYSLYALVLIHFCLFEWSFFESRSSVNEKRKQGTLILSYKAQ